MMKTWSNSDIFGFLLVVFGIICLLFANSSILIHSSFLLACILLMHSVYKSRYDVIRFKKMLCHYQAVLSSAAGGWIAWNDDGNYIGSSKTLRSLLKIGGLDVIRISDIIDALESDNADDLAFYFNRLKKTGERFSFMAMTKSSQKKIEIVGNRMIISKVESIVIWCRDITETSNYFSEMQHDFERCKHDLHKLLTIINTIPFPIWSRDKKLHIDFCNQKYAEIADSVPETVVHDNVPLIPGTLFGQGHSLAENAKKCGRSQNIAQTAIVNGIRKRLSIYECVVSNELLVGYAVDISEEEKLASELDKVLNANNEILENLSSGIAVFSADTKLSFFNHSFQHMMKLENGWLHSHPTLGEILDELRNNRQLPEVADFQTFKKNQLAQFTSVVAPEQNLLHLPNGTSLRQFVAPHQSGGLIFIYEDVTNSLQLQRKNDSLLAVQKETIDHLYEGVMVCGSDNRVKIVNNAMCSIWNISIEQIKNIHLSDLLDIIKDQLDYEGEWNSFKEYAISNLTDRMTKTGKLMKKDGSIILFSYVPLPDGAHMHTMTDITDTCVVENAIMEKNQALDTAQRLELEFISGISNEIKEPLNLLIGFSELLLCEYFGTLNTKQAEYCKHILDASNHLHQLINNMMDMSIVNGDPSKLNKTYFKMCDVFEEAIAAINKKAKDKNVEILRKYDDVPNFFGDRARIKQAFFNILLNALQIAPSDSMINVVLKHENDKIKFLIKNKGLGYSQEKKPKMFTRIHERNNLRPIDSCSVSMSLVQSLIKMHGGEVSVTSDIEGTCVVCLLPIIHVEEKVDTGENLLELEKVVNS